MSSKDRIKIIDEGREEEKEEEESEHRRSRLWIGYSDDTLRRIHNSQRRQARSPKREDGVASSPQDVESSGRRISQRRQTQSPQQENIASLSPDITSKIEGSEPSEAYAVPDEYGNLDEVTAPSPIEPRGGQHQGYLEDHNTHSSSWRGSGAPQDFENLDEVAAPPPIDQGQKEREQGYLEDRNDKTGPSKHQDVPDDFGNMDEVAAPGAVDQPLSESPSTEEEQVKKRPPPPRDRATVLATEIYTISYLILFSIFGTLARLGLQALTFYPGAPVQTGLLWANVGGSFIMGFLSEDQRLFRDEPTIAPPRYSTDEEKGDYNERRRAANENHAAFKKTLPLYIGLATGFCGSFTSFSSFIRDAFFALSNALPVPVQHPSSAPIAATVDVSRNPGYSFLAVLAVLILTTGLSLMALQFGAHVALFLQPYTPSISFLFGRRSVDLSVVFLASGCWLAALFMAIWPPDRPGGPIGDATWMQETWRSQALFALVFAPLGCLLRFYASIHLNGRIKTFPLGTFAVNIFGTAMLAMFIDLQRVPVGDMVGCQVLQGWSDGFCGCLTTVSTWVAELKTLRLKHAYFYGLMSFGVGLSLFTIITGSLQWKRGFAEPLCVH